MNIVTLVIMVLTGLLFCFFGFRWNKILVSLCGGVCGYTLTNYFLSAVITDPAILVGLSIIVAVAVAAISYSLYKLGIFLIGFIIIGFLAVTVIPWEIWNLVGGLILGLVGGYLGVKFYKYGVIIYTSIIGAGQILGAVAEYFKINEQISFILALILMLVGICFQVTNNRGKKAE